MMWIAPVMRFCTRNAITASAAALLLLSSVAVAQNVPQSPWVVGPINAPSSSGVSYCSMKADYTDGHTLVFARDATGTNSLAIDFHKKKRLTSGRQYQINLAVGEMVREMVAIAATQSVLIIQMGVDPDFYMMLARGERLEAAIIDETMVFSLVGTAAALEALEGCVSSLKQKKEFDRVEIDTSKAAQISAAVTEARVKAPTPPRDMHDITPEDRSMGRQAMKSSLQLEIERLNAENRRLQLENQAIQARLQTGDAQAAAAAIADKVALEHQQRLLREENLHLKRKAEQDAIMAAGRRKEYVRPQVLQPQTEPLSPPEPVAAVVPEAVFAAKKPLFTDVLERVGVVGVEPVVLDAAQYLQAANWQSGDVFGAAQEWPMQPGQTADQAAAGYMAEVRGRCTGDFAERIMPAQAVGPRQVVEAELACIGGDENDVAAALLFVVDGERMVVVTYESATTQVETALFKRDAATSALY